MRMLSRLLAIALVFGFSSMAKAGPPPPPAGGNFQVVVVDPPPTPPSYAVPITSSSFSFSFTFPCATGQDPSGFTASGCWTGYNDTGEPITSLQMTFPDTPGLNGEPASCPASGTSLDIFQVTTCNLVGSNYVLDFSDGSISADDGVFSILEAGAAPSDIGQVAGTLNTPEPSSIWLLSTGALSIGLFGAYRRRHNLVAAPPRLR
ncbi:MAG: PEP-CTERM sorting domain-containing protein [Acidobacteriaceae bacterium]|jgi:hypothetical protein